MPIYSIDELRSTAPKEFQGMSDLGLIGEFAKRNNQDPYALADYFGLKTGKDSGPIAAGLKVGGRNLAGSFLSTGAAVADTFGATDARDSLNRAAGRQQTEAQMASRPDLDTLEQISSDPSKYLPGLGYQIAQQGANLVGAAAATFLAPEVALPAAATRGMALLPRLAGGGGLRVGMSEAEALAANAAGKTTAQALVKGSAFNYAQGAGSLYQESVDGGDPNSGFKSLLGGIPYALAETAPEAMLFGRLAHGSGFAGGMPSRIAKAAGTQALAGATSEGLQNEMEMAYNGTVTPDQAASRRLNSIGIGGLVEGALGGLGGIRGRRHVQLGNQTDLLQTEPAEEAPPPGPQGPPPRLGYNPLAGTLTAFPDGSVALNSDQEFERRMAPQPVTPDPYVATDTGARLPANLITEPEPLQTRIERNLGIARDPVPNTAADFQQAASEPSGTFVNQQAPQGEQERQLDSGERQAQLLGLLDEQDQLRATTEARKAELDARDARAQAAGLQGTKALDVFGKLEQAVTDGLITKTEMAQELGNLTAKNPRYRQVEKFLEARAETKKVTTDANAQESEATSRLVIDREAAKASAARAATPTTQDPNGQGSTSGGQPVAAAQPGQPVGEVPLKAPKVYRLPGKPALAAAPAPTVKIGRKDRKQVDATADELFKKLENAPPELKQRLALVLGDSESGPRSYDEVARLEAKPGQKPVGRAAIARAFEGYGITEEAISRAASASLPDAVSPEEVGITKNEEGSEQNNSGMRVEDSLSKAANEGLMYGRPLTPQEKAARQAADALLAPGTGAPEKFLAKYKVETEVFDQETNALVSKTVPATDALKAIKEDLEKLQAFRKCITGG